MAPDTCEPTCTLITSFIVPVPSTTSCISPCSTSAVTCWACALRFHPSTRKSAATTTAEPIRSHLILGFIHALTAELRILDCSLVAQRFDRIEQRSFPRRVISEKHAYRSREKGGYNYGF